MRGCQTWMRRILESAVQVHQTRMALVYNLLKQEKLFCRQQSMPILRFNILLTIHRWPWTALSSIYTEGTTKVRCHLWVKKQEISRRTKKNIEGKIELLDKNFQITAFFPIAQTRVRRPLLGVRLVKTRLNTRIVRRLRKKRLRSPRSLVNLLWMLGRTVRMRGQERYFVKCHMERSRSHRSCLK